MTRPLSCVLTALVWLVLPSLAIAQIGPPVKLGPPDSGNAADSHQLTPPPDATAAATPDQTHVPEGISANSLAPPDPEAAGALSAAERPFGVNLWQGSSKSFVMTFIPRIGTTWSPALNDLALRVLASPATPPLGDSPKGALTALRAERLTNALGRADVAYSLLGTISTGDQGEIMAQISADLAFLSGDSTTACGLINSHTQAWQSPYWAQGVTACEALNGRGDDARLGLDLMREAKVKDDGFAAVVEIALGDGAKLPDSLPSPQPMALALLAKAGSPLPKRALDSANAAIIRAIALGGGFPQEQRLDATERSVSFGALPPGALTDAYLATPLQGDDRDSPLNRAAAAGGSHGRAILFNAAHDAASPVAKANFLVTLFATAPQPDLYYALMRASETLILEIPASADLSAVAPVLARALYALDRPAEAAKWIAVADPTAATALLPLAHIVDPKSAPPLDGLNLTDLLKGDGKDAASAARRAVLATQLLAALSAPLPDSAALSIADATPASPIPMASGAIIDNEAAAGREGGTILAVLAALGAPGASASGAVLAEAVRGLRAVGLGEEARHLAINAAIAAGL